MHSTPLISAFLLSASCLVSAQNDIKITAQGFVYNVAIPTSANDAQSKAIESDVSAYLATVLSATYVNSVLSTAIPSTTVTENDFQLTTEPWFQSLPTDVAQYVISVENAVASVVTKDVAAAAPPRPTGGVQRAMGAAAALGAVGVVAAMI